MECLRIHLHLIYKSVMGISYVKWNRWLAITNETLTFAIQK